MLTRVLLRYGLSTAALVLALAGAIVFFAFGEAHVLGVLVGGALVVLDGAGLVYLVGRLMDQDTSVAKKSVFTLILVVKLAVVGGLLWWSLQRFSGLGILIGIAVGLTGLIVGLSRGSTSKEGLAAMDQEAARIREETEDNGSDSG
ncbi:MAG: hypothetical protein IPG45_35080 [Deltaproteobacteria bacterium]|nr:hypothetical protein [Deltaproteobacteria bacterium]